MSLCLTVCLTHCTQRACVCAQGMHAFTRRACTLGAFVRACTQRACTRSVTPCVRSHGVGGCVRASVLTACVRACTVLACTRRGCVHPSSAWCIGRCFSATTTWRAHVHSTCVRAHGVRSRTRHVRAHCMRVCTRRSLVHPSSAVSIVCRSLLQRCHRRRLLICCPALVCSSAGVYTGALVGPPCKPRLPRCATCHRDAAAVASCTLRQQSGPASTDAGTPYSCCNRIRDLAAVTDPLCCCGAPALPPFCAACWADQL
jgi:hypothetical protein